MQRTTKPGQAASEPTEEQRLEQDITVNVPSKSPAEVQDFFNNPPMLKIPNPVTVPSPFFVHSRRLGDPGFHDKPVRLTWGDNTVAVLEGAKLTTGDEDVFLALAKIARLHESLVFRTTINEIVRAMGSSVARDTRDKVLKSLKRMQLAAVGLTLPDGDEYHVTMLPEYYLKPDGTVLINLDKYFQRMFLNKMVTRLDSSFRAALKGEVAKRLYSFFQRHWGPNKPYQMSLRKLCRSINLPTEGKPPWRLRQQIIYGLQELREKGYLKTWTLENNRLIKVIFSPAKHADLTEEALEEASQAEAWKRHERRMEKKKAKLRQREEGVPPGECPHGREFGRYSDMSEQCRLCGREVECEDALIELEEAAESKEPAGGVQWLTIGAEE